MSLTELNEYLLDFNPNQNQLTQLDQFADLLIAENKKYNLTTITSKQEIYQKHFLDSLLFTKALPLTNQQIADVGSGAGFPGIVLKIMYPQLKVYLIESSRKKSHFLNLLVNKLQLTEISIINDRVENLVKNYHEAFDIVTARAVTELNVLIETCAQLVKINGYLIALKGPKVQEELLALNNAYQKLNFSLTNKQKLELVYGTRINLFFQKNQSTDVKFPRTYNEIKKSPLGKTIK